MKITIINYGLSNLLSVQRAFERFGADVLVTDDKTEIANATALVLPGVGAFADGMKGLQELDIIDIIKQKCAEKVPFMGICLGMQMMFDESDEFGIHKGLGLIAGRVEKIPSIDIDGDKQCVPHIGWNKIECNDSEKLSFSGTALSQIAQGDEMYFVHSFEAKPSEKKHALAYTNYGGRKICAVARDKNVMGCQFHPEKSGEKGLLIVEEYIKMCR